MEEEAMIQKFVDKFMEICYKWSDTEGAADIEED